MSIGIALLSFLSVAFGSAGVTYYGRLLKPTGEPVSSTTVDFKIQIRTPGNENCLMYEEVQRKDLSASNGVFAITINDGSGTVSPGNFTLDRAFQNRGIFTFGAGKCVIGAPYSPNPADGRRLAVEFNDGSGWEPMPAQAINFVPMSLEAMTVGGYNAGSLLRVENPPATGVDPLTNAQYDKLVDLADGTSVQYLQPSSALDGSRLTAGSVPNAAISSLMWSKLTGIPTPLAQIGALACADGKILKTASGAWTCADESGGGGGGGSVTSVLTGTGLTGGPITGSGTISIAAGGVGATELATNAVTTGKIADDNVTGAKLETLAGLSVGTYGSASAVPAVTIDTKGRITAITTNPITGLPPTAVGANGKYLKSDGTNWAASSIVFADIKNGMGASAFNVGACTAGQTVSWSSLTDSLTCMNIAITESNISGTIASSKINGNIPVAQIAGLGALATLNVGTGLTSSAGNLNVNFAADTTKVAKTGDTMSGSLTLSAGTITAPANGLVVGTSQLVASGGRVGVGTASPGTALDVNGGLRAGSEAVVTVCNASLEGTQRYNYTSHAMEYCNGSVWQPASAGGMGVSGSVARRFLLPAASTRTNQILRVQTSKKLVYSDGTNWYYTDGLMADYFVSCLDYANDGATTDGLYTVDPDGPGGVAPFDVYCDMTTDGGGWTLVARVLAASTTHDQATAIGTLTAPDQLTTAKLADDDVNLMPFTRIRQVIETIGTVYASMAVLSLGTTNFSYANRSATALAGPYNGDYLTMTGCSSDCGVATTSGLSYGNYCGYRYYASSGTKRPGMGCKGNFGKNGTVWVR